MEEVLLRPMQLLTPCLRTWKPPPENLNTRDHSQQCSRENLQPSRAQSQRMCWRRVLLQEPKFNQLEVSLNNHPIHIFKINVRLLAGSQRFVIKMEDGTECSWLSWSQSPRLLFRIPQHVVKTFIKVNVFQA